MNDLISIIIPIYNVDQYLPKCLDSIVKQTYKNIEIILIDDGSTDNCGRICDDYVRKDCRIKVIHKENEGVSSARNVGLEHCCGDYVAFIDADDYVLINYIEQLYNNIQKHCTNVSMCNSVMFDEHNNFQTSYHLKNMFVYCDDKLDYCRYQFLYSPWGKLFQKKVLKNVRFDTEIMIGEDALFVAQTLLKSNSFYFDSQPLYMYRMHGSSTLHTADQEKLETWLIAWEKISNLHSPNSRAYWNAKLFYLTLYRWLVNADSTRISSFQREVKQYTPIFWRTPGHFKRKLLLFLLSYFPSFYFLFHKASKSDKRIRT